MTSIQTNTWQPAGLGNLPELGKTAADGASFKDTLLDSIHEVNAMQQDADRAVEAMSVGEDVNPAQVLTAVQKADMAFRMMMQVRNKLVEAYSEIKDIRI
jgi:flagellar hook-basal body complex protein FliE